ncbi:MAG: hypothetical protein WC596_03985 [Candidatus Shapirobacteria bacterium]
MQERIRKLQTLKEAEERVSAVGVAQKDTAIKAVDKDKLADCVAVFDMLGINQGLNEINQELLQGRGRVMHNSGIKEGSWERSLGDGAYENVFYRYAEAGVCLKWIDGRYIVVNITTDAENETYKGYSLKFSYTGDLGDSEVVLEFDRVRGKEHRVTGGGVVEYYKQTEYTTEELKEACLNKLASICLSMQEGGLFTHQRVETKPEPPRKRKGFFGL